MDSVNEMLYFNMKDWLKQCNAVNLAKQYPISRPFYHAVTDEYLKSGYRIMIVGQEAADYGLYTSKWSDEEIQQFNINYTSTQLGYKKVCKYNHSPFWNIFRRFKTVGIEPSWNNIDKFHQVGETQKTIPLTEEIEKIVDASYGYDHKSLLIREIEITRPSVILFVIGPYYHKALSYTFDVDDEKIQVYKPSNNSICNKLPSSLIQIDTPVFWTYHPAYLNRIHSMELVIKTVNIETKT